MYSFESRVRYSECDENGRLGVVPMINYLQDCSTFHCEDRGEGIRELGRKGFGWILAAWQIEVRRLPEYGENIAISTWCYEMKRLHALRNFKITDENGEALVRADSQWFIYELNENKVARIPETQDFYLEDTPRLDMPKLARKLKCGGKGTACSPTLVSAQHLDTNQHVNNAQYVLMAIDALSELGIEAPLARLSVQYRSMARLGDAVAPVVYACEGGHDVSLNDPDGNAYAVVRLQER
ncbi:acyl-[acyl-carrier-protein] thioesterase [Paratractidigestivibacter sp.]|uniref:acyl-[acyl-carrier-protein] thioesterase n=1 Tax=Paratractidigestivibacter sp. TaxID=2847316 RepID=UPI002ABE06A1|nr:acyl-ACP thioesterase domain-containing protein [Paratractidigestivibacter sp.]